MIEDELRRIYTKPEEDYRRCVGICSDFCCNFTETCAVFCDGTTEDINICYITGKIISEDRRVVVR